MIFQQLISGPLNCMTCRMAMRLTSACGYYMFNCPVSKAAWESDTMCIHGHVPYNINFIALYLSSAVLCNHRTNQQRKPTFSELPLLWHSAERVYMTAFLRWRLHIVILVIMILGQCMLPDRVSVNGESNDYVYLV